MFNRIFTYVWNGMKKRVDLQPYTYIHKRRMIRHRNSMINFTNFLLYFNSTSTVHCVMDSWIIVHGMNIFSIPGVDQEVILMLASVDQEMILMLAS
ncbi:CLUMA_CG021052, isoform A [Clunio marinus]|uniref:CLUMA_CG021052, isoform A n=1 Tax=Clunio marinus TaxID=568069 RepID=A0A1J1J6W5_9DIPT|nr:CLUMA_CG021052, isoform A [Clunio marinus]